MWTRSPARTVVPARRLLEHDPRAAVPRHDRDVHQQAEAPELRDRRVPLHADDVRHRELGRTLRDDDRDGLARLQVGALAGVCEITVPLLDPVGELLLHVDDEALGLEDGDRLVLLQPDDLLDRDRGRSLAHHEVDPAAERRLRVGLHALTHHLVGVEPLVERLRDLADLADAPRGARPWRRPAAARRGSGRAPAGDRATGTSVTRSPRSSVVPSAGCTSSTLPSGTFVEWRPSAIRTTSPASSSCAWAFSTVRPTTLGTSTSCGIR